MAISKHLEMFAGLSVVDYEPGKCADQGKLAYRLGGLERGEEVGHVVELLEQYLNEVGAGNTVALVIGAWDYDEMLEWGSGNVEVVQALIDARNRLPRLRALFLGDITYQECEISWIAQGNVTPLLLAFPQLEEFRVRGVTRLSFDKLRHGGLRQLAIESGGLPANILTEVFSAELPHLEHLELWLGTESYGGIDSPQPLDPLLSGHLFPGLRYLGLRNSQVANLVAQAVAASPLLKRLQILDLSLGNLSDEGANALLASLALRQLHKLDIHHHYVSPEVVSQLRQLGLEVDASDFHTEDEDDRYNAVSE